MSSPQDDPPVIEKSFLIGKSGISVPSVDDPGHHHHHHDDDDDDKIPVPGRTLNFAMLGCETKVPYGPLTHTAQLFMDMIGMAAIKANDTTEAKSNSTHGSTGSNTITLRIHIYNTQQMEYPCDGGWDIYDGILIPGSFSAAYDTDPWIERLKQMIQTEIVPNRRKTLGICFGHQVMAHSFSTTITTASTTNSSTNNNNNNNNYRDGRAVATPSGPRAGRFNMPLTSAGCTLFQSKSLSRKYHDTDTNNNNDNNDNNKNNNTVQLYFTHGDMVERIPNVAVTLGGDDTVPIQAVAYFAQSEDADQYRNSMEITTNNIETLLRPLPYAITMQAHPEYSTSIEMGIHRTLFQCMDAMERRQQQQQQQQPNIRPRDDAIQNFDAVQNDSIALIAEIGRMFDWF